MKRAVLPFVFLLIVSGCLVGPHYHTPCTPVAEEFSEDKPSETFIVSDEDLIEWWKQFNDPYLDCLLEETIYGNFDYRIALEQMHQARSQYWMQFTQLLPTIETSATESRFKTSTSFASSSATASTISPYQSFFQVGFDAIWELDVFGGLRRAAAAAYDTWEATAETARAVKITVLSEVANTYTAVRALQKQREIAADVVETDETLYKLAKARFDAGLSNDQDVEAALANLETDKATLVVAENNLKQTIYSFAVLLGREPEGLVEAFSDAGPIPYAAGRVPVSLPGDLLRRRPDIRAAERQLAASTEQIGVAVAALYPTFQLSGSSSSFAANPLQGANIGYTSDKLNKLFKPASLIWGYGLFTEWPIFDWGERMANVHVQYFLEHQAYLNYQKTVISAMQEAEQALAAYFNEERRQKDLSSEVQANERAFKLNLGLYEAGIADYSIVMQSRDTLLISLNNLTSSQQALTSDLIAIYKALGGDW